MRTIAGSTEFAELFFDDVAVPVANRLGEENDGWRVTMVTLGFERGTAFVGELLQSMELLPRACATLARDRRRRRGGLPRHRPAGRRARRPLGAHPAQRLPGGPRPASRASAGSVFKLAFSELRQRLAELGTDLAGPAALAWDELEAGPGRPAAGGPGNAELVDTWVNSFSRTIAAGTSQIQRNIVAERILGLPKG